MAETAHERRESSGYRLHGWPTALLRLSRACGTAPVSLQRQRSLYVVRVSRKVAFVSNLIVIVTGVVLFVALTFDVYSKIYKDTTQDTYVEYFAKNFILQTVSWFLKIAMIIVSVRTGTNRMRRFLSYAIKIQKVQVSIDNRPMPKSSERRLGIIIVGGVVLAIVTFFGKIAATMQRVHEHEEYFQFFLISKYVSHLISSSLVLQMTFITSSALQVLKSLNKSMKNLQSRLQCIETNREDNTTVITTIRHYTDVFATINDIFFQINATEGFMMMLLLLNYAFQILVFLYYTKYYLSGTESTAWFYLIGAVQVWHCFYMVFNIVILVEPCHRTHREIKRTQVLISQLLCIPPSAVDGVSVELIRFYKRTEHQQDVYTPLGTFKFSRSLYSALIGTLTTLIFILIHV